MANINADFKKLEKMTGRREEEIIDCLTKIGMPVEEEEGEVVVEITPNRPDLFCIEGIARAVIAYYDKKIPEYTSEKSEYSMEVSKETRKVRPEVSAAVVKDLEIDEGLLEDLMQMQEKLHQTIGRKRKKVAVGIHNLDNISGKLEYVIATGEKMVPLETEEEMGIREVLKKHPKGRAYSHLVPEGKAVLIKDEKGVVSFPPVINSERTRVTEKTRNLLIEATGTSRETVRKTVNIIATALAERGGKLFQVKIDGETHPDFTEKKIPVNMEKAGAVLGIGLDMESGKACLQKMGVVVEEEHALVPPYRADIISFTDIIEDIAIGYGYENLEPTLPQLTTTGKENRKLEPLHDAMTGMEFLEVKNYFLTNPKKLWKVGKDKGAVAIENSASEEFTHLRTTLISGVMECFATNKMKGLPQKIYECGKIYKEGEKESLCFAIIEDGASLTTLQPFLQTLARWIGKKLELKAGEGTCFIEGRCAEVFLDGKRAGIIGSVHPEILKRYGLEYPVAVCELDVRKLVE
ncbi:phenylalanine--tRNA ligase subunit beta [Candidatus Micrarchaeota archaeon]|nr:phenylalanine--tRNA ligase subunit beta [Candidatus Micrarchaeota archaeon]